jgi:hypothetical protein
MERQQHGAAVAAVVRLTHFLTLVWAVLAVVEMVQTGQARLRVIREQ